jgi:diguanylate cyclase (GGDEF)-like protein
MGTNGEDPPVEASDSGPLSGDHPRLGDRDQTLSDQDQTLSDRDQTLSDRDQTLSDRDQQASDDDRASSSSDAGGAPESASRARTTAARSKTARERDEGGHARDRTASDRDREAAERDELAARRDHEADLADELALTSDDSNWFLHRHAPRVPVSGERDDGNRERAVLARQRAAGDRRQAAADRELAAHDREQARRDREDAGIDELTGARRRGVGLEELQREIDRARRMGQDLVVAYIDVDGLEHGNDTYGQSVGDVLLRDVVKDLRQLVRSYDVLVRVGGDEFVCVLPGVSVGQARQRFEALGSDPTAGPRARSVSVGLTALREGDGAPELIERAGRDLLAARSR